MSCILTPAPLQGTVQAIPSKSAAHRALICAALADTPCDIDCPSVSEDIEATAFCLRTLGADVQRAQTQYHVVPIPTVKSRTASYTLCCGESGSTLRFLLPVACALGGAYHFSMKGRLPQRPLSPLYEELSAHGADLDRQGKNPFSVSGKIHAGIYRLDGGVSSQFFSGLLFALPLLEGESQLIVEGKLESRPYVDMTLSMLSQFGITIPEIDDTFIITGNNHYHAPESIAVEGDWSAAAAWLCAGALAGDGITCTGLDINSRQGDRKILDILRRFGAEIEMTPSGAITVRRRPLHGIELDVADTPDLVPVLSALACGADGVTVIRGAARLRLKESDRLFATAAALNGLGAHIEQLSDGLRIVGGQPLAGGTASAYGDHRIAMSAAVASVLCKKTVTLVGHGSVSKSYPNFWKDFTTLGGQLRLDSEADDLDRKENLNEQYLEP